MSWFVPNVAGEWWIDDGQVEFADGDVGDMDHVGYVIAGVTRKILGAAGLEADDEYPQLPEGLNRRGDAPKIEALLRRLIEDPEERANTVRVALDYQTPDPRDFAVQYWGWIRLKGQYAQVWNLTSKSLKSLADGIAQAAMQNGDDDEELDAETFSIETMSPRAYYPDVPYGVLAQAKPAALREYRQY